MIIFVKSIFIKILMLIIMSVKMWVFLLFLLQGLSLSVIFP